MDGPISDRDSEPWDLLLYHIAQGSVVPIVGRDLLTVGPGATLYSDLAVRLAAALHLPAETATADPSSPLNAVASRHIVSGGEVDDIYRSIARIMKQMPPAPIPDALRKLAAIDRFSLFVTTTFDDLLTRAVTEARGAPPRVLNFSTRMPADDLTPAADPTIYHLFGRVSALQDYVVTEEDALELVFSLQASRKPTQLLHELGQRSLLIVGCSFPAWSVRFFLRLTRGRRLLFSDREKIAFIVEPGASADAGLLQFLDAFRTRTEVFAHHTADAFVNELHDRWTALNPAVPRDEMTPGSVFVSYASEDRERVEPIVRALRARELPVWFDREALGPGDHWQRKIERNIDLAAAFVPILSLEAIKKTDRYYIDEWKQSLEHNRRIAFDDEFLFPIAIDTLSRDSEAIPKAFRDAQWTSIVGDAVPDSLVEALNKAIRRKKAGARR